MAVSRVVQGMAQDTCGKAEQWRWAMRIFEAERLESWMKGDGKLSMWLITDGNFATWKLYCIFFLNVCFSSPMGVTFHRNGDGLALQRGSLNAALMAMMGR